jgi:NNP family nitrate/nitrite transporter-like MFS transporter
MSAGRPTTTPRAGHGRHQASIESAAVLGFSGAMAPTAASSSQELRLVHRLTGSPDMALYGFVVFYVTCLAVTWWWYYRRGAETPC